MSKKFYEKLSRPFEENPGKLKILTGVNHTITRLIYLVYPLLLIWLIASRDQRFWKVLLVPALSFLAVTLFRKCCNARRPYEKWSDLPPLIPKDTKGHSFPSRHAFSIYIIAMAAWYVWMPPGIILCIAGVLLAASRVIARIHFVRDVVAGALIAILIGIFAFFA